MKIYPFSKVILILLFSMLLMIPATAQEVSENEELDTVEMSFTGYISFDEDGNVYIDGYFLAPAGAIPPSALSEGQYVEVTGIFLNDDTFKLTEIDTSVEEPFDSTDDGEVPGEEPTCDPATETCEEPTCDPATETCEEPTCDPATETCEEPTCDPATEECEPEDVCTPDGHPVAARIADAFDVDACEVEAMHDEGNGFGNIAKAYLLAEAANQALMDALEEGGVLGEDSLISPEDFIAMHESGMGWGQIIKSMGDEYGVDVHPSDLAPGKLKKRAANDDDDTDTNTDADSEAFSSTSTNGNGNNGNGNGNGNNGNNGNGNGNGNNGNNGNVDKGNNGNNGNGNGNGNNGNNGNGNGNSKGKGKKK